MNTLQSISRIFCAHKTQFLAIAPAYSFASIPKKSASLIIARQNGLNKGNLFDYDVFFLKRPSTGSFSDVHAFPGGQLEDEDSHHLSGARDDNNSHFLNCALRETFEETGFFFTKQQLSIDDAKRTARQLNWDDHICFYELSSYLPAEFSNDKILPFLRLITVPAIKTRYDCYFYLLAASELNILNWNKFINTKEDKFLRDTEDILINEDESVAYEWMNPLTCLERSFKREIQLAPPQFMLLNIMSSFFKLADLTNFLSAQSVPVENSDLNKEEDILSSDPYFFPYLIGLQSTSKINPQQAKQYPFTALMGGDVKYQLKKILEQEEDTQLKAELTDKVGGLNLTEQARNRVYFKDPKKLFGDEYEVEINCSQRSPFVHLKSYKQLKDLIAKNKQS